MSIDIARFESPAEALPPYLAQRCGLNAQLIFAFSLLEILKSNNSKVGCMGGVGLAASAKSLGVEEDARGQVTNQEQNTSLDDGETQSQMPLAQSTDSRIDELNKLKDQLQLLLESLRRGIGTESNGADDIGSSSQSADAEQQISLEDILGRI